MTGRIPFLHVPVYVLWKGYDEASGVKGALTFRSVDGAPPANWKVGDAEALSADVLGCAMKANDEESPGVTVAFRRVAVDGSRSNKVRATASIASLSFPKRGRVGNDGDTGSDTMVAMVAPVSVSRSRVMVYNRAVAAANGGAVFPVTCTGITIEDLNRKIDKEREEREREREEREREREEREREREATEARFRSIERNVTDLQNSVAGHRSTASRVFRLEDDVTALKLSRQEQDRILKDMDIKVSSLYDALSGVMSVVDTRHAVEYLQTSVYILLHRKTNGKDVPYEALWYKWTEFVKKNVPAYSPGSNERVGHMRVFLVKGLGVAEDSADALAEVLSDDELMHQTSQGLHLVDDDTVMESAEAGLRAGDVPVDASRAVTPKQPAHAVDVVTSAARALVDHEPALVTAKVKAEAEAHAKANAGAGAGDEAKDVDEDDADQKKKDEETVAVRNRFLEVVRWYREGKKAKMFEVRVAGVSETVGPTYVRRNLSRPAPESKSKTKGKGK